jgi:hypothetical protein
MLGEIVKLSIKCHCLRDINKVLAKKVILGMHDQEKENTIPPFTQKD